MSFGRTWRGLRTVIERRGAGYLGYLAAGVVWPRAAYRFAWGPSARPVARGAFAAAAALSTRRPTTDELRQLGLMASTSASASRTTTPETADIERLMNRAHAAGITGIRHALAHVVRDEDGSARVSAFPRARRFRRRGAGFHADRDADRVAFNRRFQTALLTEASARSLLRDRKAAVPPGYRHYAPIDFGGGLGIGQVAATDSGTGRWEFFNRAVVAPLVHGRRVLDLGSNNGSLPLMMLRAGAASVTGIEFTPQIAEFARLNARILAWRDLRDYDIQFLTGDMRMFLDADLGSFDVVTAFCSLYYLPEADMARIIRKAADMGASLVLQANEVITNLPARASDLRRLVLENGYRDLEFHTHRGFSRPLLVARAPIAAAAAGAEIVKAAC